jgi:hypothetical protein
MSRKSKALLMTAAVTMQLAVVVLVGAGPASAAVGPADDRQKSTPTSWWTYTGITAASVNSHVSANGARLTDIQVDNASTPTFTVVMVKNSSSYASSWWWYYGLTQASVSAQLSSHNARLISARAYSTSAGTRYAVVMVSNTGANAKSWWWYHGTTTYIASQLSAHHARLINFSPYPGGGYLGIMVDNTGTNAVSGWWWYYGVSTTSVNAFVSANHARIIDLSRNSNGTYNVVMYYNASTRWYWYYGQSPSSAVSKALQRGARIIDATSYYVNGTKYYTVAMINNLSGLNNTLWNIIGPKVDSGTYGFYLKQVSSTTKAALYSTKQYEPASALKVLYHAKSIHEEALGHSFDSSVITYHYNTGDPTNVGICPDSYATTATTNLKNADTQMMMVSDNRMTRGIVQKYGGGSYTNGWTVMENYGASLGLTSTQINHNIGCPTSTTHNRTTLVDLGKVYEKFQTNGITSSSAWKTQFKNRMLNQTNYSSGFHGAIDPIVHAEAVALGKSPSVEAAFEAALTWIAKGGSYDYGSGYPRTVSYDGVSMTGVPYKSSGTIAPRYFIFGEFVDGTSLSSDTERNAMNTARGQLYTEGMRGYIHAALATW